MANTKISEMPAASTPLTGAELMELSQLSGGSYDSVQAAAEDVAYAGIKIGSFYDTTDQTGSVSAATSIKFGSNDINTKGVTVVTDGTALTRITYATAGTYSIATSLQFANSDTNDHEVTIWFAKDGSNIANSATVINVPKAADGGNNFFQIVYYVTVTAGQYIQIKWLPTNVAVTLDAIAAGAIAPAAPSAIVVTERIDL